LIKNPGSCACCGCFLVVVLIVLGIVAYALLAQYFILIAVAALLIWAGRDWYRYAQRKRAERDQL
jgi:uncharacterized membrane protein